jgi:MFS family permease
MYKLWFLLAVDSLADGMVPYSLTNYYMDIKFHPAKSTLGDVTSASYFLAAIGSAFAGPLARKLGLINTMVFTHVPSSSAVLVFPFPNVFWMTAGLLLVRAGLNNMDQAPRAAFIAAVVKPEERTAAMGITSMLRTLASMAGPTLTGVMAANEQFWIAFVVAGVCRLIYDFGLYALFVNMVIDPQDGKEEVSTGEIESGADEVEMQSLVSDDSDGKAGVDGAAESTATYANSLQPPANPRARSRSPRRGVVAD